MIRRTRVQDFPPKSHLVFAYIPFDQRNVPLDGLATGDGQRDLRASAENEVAETCVGPVPFEVQVFGRRLHIKTFNKETLECQKKVIIPLQFTKMHNLTLYSILWLCASSCATVYAEAVGRGYRDGGHCLSDKEASDIVTKYTSLFVKLDVDLANQLLTDDVTFYSDSTNFATPNNTKPRKFVSASRQREIEALERIFLVGLHGCTD